VAPGRSGKLVLHKGDDPKVITHNFAQAFTLNKEMENTIFLAV